MDGVHSGHRDVDPIHKSDVTLRLFTNYYSDVTSEDEIWEMMIMINMYNLKGKSLGRLRERVRCIF